MKAYATIKNKEIVWYNPSSYEEGVEIFEGKMVEVNINLPKSKRSIDQNSIYWKVLTIISEYTGHTKEELHEFFIEKFLSDKIEVFGEEVTARKSTTKLTVKEFTDYLTDIKVFMIDYDVVLPI